YVPGAYLCFDHHLSETIRNKEQSDNHVINAEAPSAARVVYEHFGGAARFPQISVEMMDAVDKADSAQYVRDEILNPTGWVLLNYLMDARTGLGRFREFRISNYALMMDLIQYCRDQSIAQILELPDVRERVDVYREHADNARAQIERCSTVYNRVVVLDLRNEETIWATNRFMVYALFPQVKVSIHAMWGVQKQNTVFALGKSILDRSSRCNIGELMLQYGGGGHHAAGTCQVPNDQATPVLRQLIETVNAAG
ncbi:MAG TPA: exopolyphosphatase, partial [Burkholderiaceae bacterium]